MAKLGANRKHSNKSAGAHAMTKAPAIERLYSNPLEPLDYMPGPKFHKTMIRSSNTQMIRKSSSLPRSFPKHKTVTSPAGRKRGT